MTSTACLALKKSARKSIRLKFADPVNELIYLANEAVRASHDEKLSKAAKKRQARTVQEKVLAQRAKMRELQFEHGPQFRLLNTVIEWVMSDSPDDKAARAAAIKSIKKAAKIKDEV